jgi:hypothetical protein
VALVEIAFTRIEDLREILHRLEHTADCAGAFTQPRP